MGQSAVLILLQLIAYLLGVYLIFKGFELFQMALTSPRADEGRTIGLVLGAAVFLLSIMLAGAFFYLVTRQGTDMATILFETPERERPRETPRRPPDRPLAPEANAPLSAASHGEEF